VAPKTTILSLDAASKKTESLVITIDAPSKGTEMAAIDMIGAGGLFRNTR